MLVLTAYAVGKIDKVECVKALRDINDCGLKISKDIVNSYEQWIINNVHT